MSVRVQSTPKFLASSTAVKMAPRPSLIPDVTDTDTNSEDTNQQPAIPPPSTKPATPPVDRHRRRPDRTSRLSDMLEDDEGRRIPQEVRAVLEQDMRGLRQLYVCRRKKNDMEKKLPQQDSTDSSLDVPLVELQRRHSEIRLGGGLNTCLGSGLAPPRSPELRRHSDVSPASLKELEKLKGAGQKSGDPDWGRRGGRSGATSRQNSPPRETAIREATRSRRASRAIARQHSYDDEVKPTAQPAQEPAGLGLPAPMPRRASAYDVFTVLPLSTVTPTSGRRASFRAPPAAPTPEPTTPPSPEKPAPAAALILPEEDRRTRRRGSQL
ncbi:hypothetical protein QE152_g7434 [Popillia japonica]|uniref:Uncharacterized protein n=1 Tax=Popillia japonica TaxID=7064 RepID=A0AAW1MFY6_POPJA